MDRGITGISAPIIEYEVEYSLSNMHDTIVFDDGVATVEERGVVALHRRHGVVRVRLLRAKDVDAGVFALRARRRVVHDGPDDGDFVPAASEARRLDVHKQQQPAARCTHPLPI